jgi:colicin import membrane protein
MSSTNTAEVAVSAPEPTEAQGSLALISATLTEFEKVQAGLTELRSRYTDVVFDVRSTKGMDEAKAARLAIREPRYAVQRALDAAKKPLNEIKRNISERAEYITGQILEIEGPIDQQIKVEEARREEERQARIKAEQDRVAALRARVEEIAAAPVVAAGKASSDIALAIVELDALAIDESFEEFQPHAQDAKTTALEQLRKLHDAALEREQEAERLAAERAEIERIRAEQAAQAAELERQRQEQQQAAARAAAEAALAAQKAIDEANANARRLAAEREAFMKAQQDAFEAEKAEAQALLDQQRRELAEQQARIAAEVEAKRRAEEAERAAREAAEGRAKLELELRHAKGIILCVAHGLAVTNDEAEQAIVRAAATITAYSRSKTQEAA